MSLASQIVNNCLAITSKDNVTIFLYPHNLTLAEEIADECFKNGADVNLSLYSDQFLLSYMTRLSVESLEQPSVFCRALTENSTAEIWMAGTSDPSILRKIPPEKNSASNVGEFKAHWPATKEHKVRSLSLGVSLVTKQRAATYGFDFERWRRMVYAASNVDYSKLAETGKRLKETLQGGRSVEILGPEETKLALDISGRRWYLSDGVVDEADVAAENFGDEIPAGSLYAAPLEESAQGTISFNVKIPYLGRQIGRLKWKFDDGRVVEFSGDPSIKPLKQEWDQAPGDKDRIASLWVGLNPKAEAGYTSNNIVSGAVSVGIGGNEDIGGKNKPGFSFVDTIVGATLRVDGKTIIEKGRLS